MPRQTGLLGWHVVNLRADHFVEYWIPAKPVRRMKFKFSSGARGIFGALASILIALGTGCHAQQGPAGQLSPLENTVTLRRGLGGEPGTLDPGAAVDSFSLEVLGDLYEGLTAETADGSIVPGVAAWWTVDSAGKKYEFHLRHDARWSNGAPVRAQDFVNAWRRLVDPKQASPMADNLRVIVGAGDIIAGHAIPSSLGVLAPRDDVLQVVLTRPAPYFPQLLTHYSAFPVFSESAARSHDSRTWVSNGAYVLSSWTPGGTLQLQKNPSYWDRDHVGIANVIYVPLPDENAECLRYRAGELDLTQSVPAAALASIRAETPNELHIAPFLGTMYYAFNLRAAPFKTNVALRKALVMAVDRRAILKSIQPFGQQPAFGFVPPGTWNYQPQSWDWADTPDATRIAEAKLSYAKAGFSIQTPLHLKLLFNSSPGIKQIAIAIAAMWRETLGIETELIDEEYRVFLDSRKHSPRWDVVRLAWLADYNDAGSFLDTFRSDSPNNDSGYDSPQFNALIEEAENTADVEKRREILEMTEKIMLADYPVIPIYFLSSKRLFKPYIRGETANPLNRLYSKHLTIEAH
jgi:oligopeptide transport system substrate-binding protein